MSSPADAGNLSRSGCQSTPSISASWGEGLLIVSGESYPENTYEVYDPLISWVETFLARAGRPLRLELQLNYLNTSSVRAMIDIFDLLESADRAGKDVLVHWLYDRRNPRAAELGEEFKEDYSFPFSILPVDLP